jgi:hypothetical protein
MQLPKGWSMAAPKDTNLTEDWLEYHGKYSFKDGVFTADRVALVKMSQVPLNQWDKYLDFRRAMFDDLNQRVLIMPPEPFLAADWQDKIATIVARETNDASLPNLMQPLRDATQILDANPPPAPHELDKATDLARKGVNAIEAKSLELPADDIHSLYWAQMLSYAWYTLGKSAFQAKDMTTAENYLRAAWRLSQDRLSGYQYGKVLEAMGNKAAAHQYELAHATSASNAFASFEVPDSTTKDQIAADYKRVTGKPLTSSSLNNGRYDGSIRAELDKELEIHELVRTTKLNGQAFFSVVFETGRPTKANLLSGEKELASLIPTLQAHAYAPVIPAGSKARLLRQVRVICTPYAGCDAYILLPSAIQMPAINFRRVVIPVNQPKGSKTVEIQMTPQ